MSFHCAPPCCLPLHAGFINYVKLYAYQNYGAGFQDYILPRMGKVEKESHNTVIKYKGKSCNAATAHPPRTKKLKSNIFFQMLLRRKCSHLLKQTLTGKKILGFK